MDRVDDKLMLVGCRSQVVSVCEGKVVSVESCCWDVQDVVGSIVKRVAVGEVSKCAVARGLEEWAW